MKASFKSKIETTLFRWFSWSTRILIQCSPIYNDGALRCFPQHRNLRHSITLPGCSIKMSCRRLVGPERVVQYWNSLAWDAVEARSINGFQKGWTHSWETVLPVAKYKRQDATFTSERFKAHVCGKLKRYSGRGSFYTLHAVTLFVNHLLSVTFFF